MAKNNSMIKYPTDGSEYVTGRVIFYYPALKTPKRYKDNENNALKYSVVVLMDKDSPDVENLKKLITKEWKEGKIPKSGKNPLKNGNDKVEERAEEGKGPGVYENRFCLFAASKFPIKVIDASKNIWVGEDSEINGWIGRVKVVLKAFDNDGNKGVTAYLQAAQIIEPGIEIGKDHSKSFDIEEVNGNKEDDTLPF